MNGVKKIFIKEIDNLNKINNFIDNLSKILKLNITWNKENIKEIELKKCFMRGLIRESNITGMLQKDLLKELNKNNYFQDFIFFQNFIPWFIFLEINLSPQNIYIMMKQKILKHILVGCL